MPQGKPAPGEFYRHFKGKLYQVRALASHSETGEQMVVYQAMYGDFRTYVRPYDMFISRVDHDKYPDVDQQYRFAYLADADSLGQAAEIAEPPGQAAKTAGSPGRAAEAAGPQEENPEKSDQDSEIANPLLVRYMDARSFSEKCTIFMDMRPQMTDKLLDELAVVSDLVIPKGNLDDRYEEMKRCLMTRMKYERER